MKQKTKDLCSALGDARIAEKLGVTASAVRVVRARGVFPATWFAGIDELCREAGIECPMDLFTFRRPSGGDGSLPVPTKYSAKGQSTQQDVVVN